MRAEVTVDKLRRFLEALPGADLVSRGPDDLARGEHTREALPGLTPRASWARAGEVHHLVVEPGPGPRRRP